MRRARNDDARATTALSPKSEPKKLSTSVLNGLTWQYVAVGSQGVAQLVVLSILSRLLSPADFGVIGAAMIFVGIASMFSQFGVGPAIVQRSEISTRLLRVGVSVSLTFGALLSAALWASAGLITDFFAIDELEIVVKAVSVVFLLAAPGVVSEALLQRSMRFKELMWVNVGSYVLGYVVVGISLATYGFGVWALVGSLLSQTLIKTIAVMRLRPVPMRPLVSVTELHQLLHFGGPFTLARVLNYGATQGDFLVVGRVLGATPLGLYSRAYQLMMLPARYVGQALERVMFPAMVKVQNNDARLSRIYLRSTAAIALIVTPMSVVMMVCAEEIVLALLGAQWMVTVNPFRILAVGILFRTSYKLGDSLAKARGALIERSRREALYLAAVLVGSIIGMKWGITGVAVGVLIAVVVNYITAAHMCLRMLGVKWEEYWMNHVGGVVLAVVSGISTYIGRNVGIAFGFGPLFILLFALITSGAASMIVLTYFPRMLGMRSISAIMNVLHALPDAKVFGLFRRIADRYNKIGPIGVGSTTL